MIYFESRHSENFLQQNHTKPTHLNVWWKETNSCPSIQLAVTNRNNWELYCLKSLGKLLKSLWLWYFKAPSCLLHIGLLCKIQAIFFSDNQRSSRSSIGSVSGGERMLWKWAIREETWYKEFTNIMACWSKNIKWLLIPDLCQHCIALCLTESSFKMFK